MDNHPELTGASYAHCACGTTVRSYTEDEAAEVVVCPRCARGYRLVSCDEDDGLTYEFVGYVEQ